MANFSPASLATPEQRAIAAEFNAQLPGLEAELDGIVAQGRVNWDEFESAEPAVNWDEFESAEEPKKGPGVVASALDSARGFATGATKVMDTVAKGIGQLGASAVEPFSQETADDWRKRTQKFYDEQEARRKAEFGEVSTPAGKVTEGVTQGVGVVGAMAANPVVGLTTLAGYTMGAGTELMDNLDKKGVPPDSSLRSSQFQVTSNAILGLIPGMGAIKGALVNWATGQASDRATYEYLKREGHEEAAKVVIGERGWADQQSLIDLLVGGIGGRMGGKGKDKSTDANVTADKTKALLDMKNKERTAEADAARVKAMEAEARGQIAPEPEQLGLPLDPYREGGDLFSGRPDQGSFPPRNPPGGEQMGPLDLGDHNVRASRQGELFGSTDNAPINRAIHPDAPKQGELPLQTRENQTAAYELATGHKTEAPESPRIDAARLEDTTQPEVAKLAPEPDSMAPKPEEGLGRMVDDAISEAFIRSQTDQRGAINPNGRELPPSVGRLLPDPNQKFGQNDTLRSEDQANRALTPDSGISDAFRRANRKESGLWNPFAKKEAPARGPRPVDNFNSPFGKRNSPFRSEGEANQVLSRNGAALRQLGVSQQATGAIHKVIRDTIKCAT